MSVNKDGQVSNQLLRLRDKNALTITSYDGNIEKPFMGHFAQSNSDCTVQPLPYIGLQPIPANTPKSANDFTNAQAVWLIETELIVETYGEINFTINELLKPWKAQNIGYEISNANDILNHQNMVGRYQLAPVTDVQPVTFHSELKRTAEGSISAEEIDQIKKTISEDVLKKHKEEMQIEIMKVRDQLNNSIQILQRNKEETVGHSKDIGILNTAKLGLEHFQAEMDGYVRNDQFDHNVSVLNKAVSTLSEDVSKLKKKQ